MYEWLPLYTNLIDDIESLKLNIKLKQRELLRWSNNVDGTQGDFAKQQTYLTALRRCNELKEGVDELNERLEQKEKEKEEIISLIDNFKGLNNRILKLKYVDGMTLQEVSSETGYGYQYIKNKHAEIMRIIKFSKKV